MGQSQCHVLVIPTLRVQGQPVQVSTSSNNNDYYCAFGLSQFAEGKPKVEKACKRESHTDSGQETLGCGGDQSPGAVGAVGVWGQHQSETFVEQCLIIVVT